MVGRDGASPGGGGVAEIDAGAPRRANLPGRLRRTLFGISPREARPERRGFHVESDERADRLERVGTTFLVGYHAALLDPRPETLAATLESEIAQGWRGFGYEGAGFGLAVSDVILPRPPWRRSRLQSFLEGAGWRHRYLVLVGAGWSLARLPRRYGSALAGLDPVLRWLAFDGYGFHHGFFAWRRAIERRRVPRRLRGYGRRAFDQGLGRSLWFVMGMDPERIAASIDRFAEDRRGHLWSGVGLACAFAGGLAAEGVAELRHRADRWAADAAQGATFAAKARGEAGEVTDWLELACAGLCGTSAAETKALADDLEADLPDDGGSLAAPEPAYEVWRRRVREALAPSARLAPGRR